MAGQHLRVALNPAQQLVQRFLDLGVAAALEVGAADVPRKERIAGEQALPQLQADAAGGCLLYTSRCV